MKKFYMIAALLAMLPPALFGNTTKHYYANLKCVVGSGSGTVYAASSATAEESRTYASSSGPSSGLSDTSSGGSVSGFCAYAKPDEGWKFLKWTSDQAGNTKVSELQEWEGISLTAATSDGESNAKTTTYYAQFQKLPPATVTFLNPINGSYTVNGEAVMAQLVKADQVTPYSVTLAATPAENFRFAGWYTLENNTKAFFSTDLTTTKKFNENVTVGAEFIPDGFAVYAAVAAKGYNSLSEALGEAESGEAISIYSNVTLDESAAVASGVSLAVSAGVTLTIASGQTLYVDGTLNNNGTVSGTVSKCTKLIRQTGKADGVPFNPYGDVKYWKTSVSNPGVSYSTSQTHATIVNGTGQEFRTTLSSSAKLIKATIDSSVAVNHIKSIAGESTSVNVVNDTLNSGMVILLGSDCVINGGLSSKTGFRGVVDCAGYNCSTVSGVEVSGNNGLCTLLNCPSFTASKVINITHTYINCTSVTLSSLNAGNMATLKFYDCGTASAPASFSVSYSSGPSATTTHNFYSGYYNSLSYNSEYKVYGGSYKNDPSSYNADVDNLEVVYDSVGKWYNVLPAAPAEYVCAIGETEYTSLSDAFNAAVNGDTILLIAAVDMAQRTATVPSGKNITISLEKHSISNGKIVNNGTLTIVDSTVLNEGDVASDIENNGTLDFVFGTYSGAVVNNAGTLTVHNGAFTGSFTKAGGTVNLKGGHFKTNVSSLMTSDDYLVYSKDGFYYVCEVPNGTMTATTVSGKAGYSATPYGDADYNLLKDRVSDNKTTRSDYTAANWIRLAELLTFYEVFYNVSLDATLQFDRVVPANSLSAYASTGSFPQSLQIKHDLDAGELYRGLSAVLVGNGYYGKQYKALWEDNIKSVSLAVSDGSSGSNAGTLCRTMIELWSSVRAPDYHDPDNKHMITNTLYVAGQKITTLGAGSNVAMIRPATGAATFYSTLAAAMSAAADGGTVMLANDCSTALPLTKTGTYTFDTMGFAFTGGAPSLGQGLFVKSYTTVDSAAKLLVSDAIATRYVVAQTVATVGNQSFENLTDAVAVALSNGEVVTLLADTNEAVVLDKGQELKLALASGVNYDAASKITCSDDRYIIQATAQSGYTLYKPKFNSSAAVIVKAAGEDGEENGYDTLAEALAAAGSGATVTVYWDITLADSAEVPAGVTLTVDSGATLTVNGALAVLGTLSNSGTVTGSGKVGNNVIVITQTGDGGASPYVAYGSTMKYYKTTTGKVTSGTITGVASSMIGPVVKVAKADGTVVCGAVLDSSPKMIYCTVNKSDAVNSISGVVSSSTATTFTADVPSTQMAVLLSTGITISGPTDTDGKIKFGGTIDCANNSFSTASTEVSGDYASQRTVIVNCPDFTLTRSVNPKYDFVGCTTIQLKTLNGKYGGWAVNFYDCRPQASVTVSFASGGTGGAWVMNYYGGQYDTIKYGNSTGFHANCKVYGGAFKSDPSNYKGTADLVVTQEGGYYIVAKGVTEDDAAARVIEPGTSGTQKLYATLEEAVSTAVTGSKIELLSHCSLSSAITVGKELTIELNGFNITAANGAFVNSGTLYIQDSSNFAQPSAVSTASGNLIVNNGTLDITYGSYVGNILLNSGTFTTHGGTFTNGTLTAGSGADPKVVANLRGGTFSQAVTSFLRDGFIQRSGKVGEYPFATVTPVTLSGAEAAWQLLFISADDKAIYAKGKSLSAHSSVADWRRYAELESSLSSYIALTPEGVAMFDRTVASGTMTFYGKAKTTSLPSQTLQETVAPGEVYPLIIRLLKANVPTPYTYSEYIDTIDTLTIGIKSTSSDNDGTVCTTELQFWQPSNMTVGEYMRTSGLAPLAQTRYMLGGKKAAIDRDGSRLTFDSLAAAVAEVQDGETILVGADTNENVTFTKSGRFTIDPYGFNWTGTVSVDSDSGLKVASQREADSLAVAQGVSSAKAVTYVVARPGTLLIFRGPAAPTP